MVQEVYTDFEHDKDGKEKLHKYELVNSCETIDELIRCILHFANKDGIIQGRTREFNAQKMADLAKKYYYDRTNLIEPNIVTRYFGLRQQLMYLKYYKN